MYYSISNIQISGTVFFGKCSNNTIHIKWKPALNIKPTHVKLTNTHPALRELKTSKIRRSKTERI